jgi:hypothetical protein
MADEKEVKQLTGEERIDALCDFLSATHGFSFPVEVFDPEAEDDTSKKAAKKGK